MQTLKTNLVAGEGILCGPRCFLGILKLTFRLFCLFTDV